MCGSKIRVLVVDDDTVAADFAKQTLVASVRPQFAVQVASSLQTALIRTRSERFDAVVLDLNLGDSRGLATLNSLCSHVPDVAVVVYTDLDDDEEVALEALHCGAQDCLPKQHGGEMLVRSVMYSVQRHHNEHEIRTLLELVCRNERLLQDKNTRLAALNEVAHQVVDNVSHEFRTPLTVIREYASLMKDGIGGQLSDQHLDFVEIISDRADDLATMVDDMLDVSRLEAGLLAMARTQCHVAEIVDRVRLGLERKANIRRVALTFDLPEDLPEVFCDPEKVGRILTNLAVNAIKFCGDNGKVSISASLMPKNKDVILRISDNGPGIAADNLAVIFERHKQLSNSAGSTKGFGLGLNIARELVENSFGQMTVDSRVGKGSTFSFTLPVAEPMEVLGRYLSRLEIDDQSTRTVSLLEVSVDGDVAVNLADDVDAFWNYLLRRNDLLLRLKATRWLLVLDADESACEAFLGRYEHTLAETNRNRLRGPLPEVRLRQVGTWQLPWQHSHVLGRASELLVDDQTVTV